LDELHRDVHLADAYCMNPDAACAGDLPLHALGINGEALPEFVAVFSTPNHSKKESREQQEQDDREEKII
jgi:hypothetical protein